MARDGVSNPETIRPRQPVLTSTQKALALLEIMATQPRSAGVSELARLVGASRGTVHKQLTTLVAAGWVEQNAQGRYGLSLQAARVGNSALRHAGLGDRIQRILEELVEATGETASVAVLEGTTGVIAQRAESDQMLHANIRVGSQMPLDSGGASNLVLLAFALSANQRLELRKKGVSLIHEEAIQRVAAEGLATSVDEVVEGVAAVSVPFRSDLEFKTMALTIAGPAGRLQVDDAIRALHAARDQIELLVRTQRSSEEQAHACV